MKKRFNWGLDPLKVPVGIYFGPSNIFLKSHWSSEADSLTEALLTLGGTLRDS